MTVTRFIHEHIGAHEAGRWTVGENAPGHATAAMCRSLLDLKCQCIAIRIGDDSAQVDGVFRIHLDCDAAVPGERHLIAGR
jgi:hypothetical protein